MKNIGVMARAAALAALAASAAMASAQDARPVSGLPTGTKVDDQVLEKASDPAAGEVAGTAAANREMAEFAARQVAENEASARRAAQGLAEYQAAVAERNRIIAQNEAAAIERERIIRENEARHRAEMEEWERQVAACRAGRRSACAD